VKTQTAANVKHRWRERGPLKPGEVQVGTPEWMKNRPEYKHFIDFVMAARTRFAAEDEERLAIGVTVLDCVTSSRQRAKRISAPKPMPIRIT
jgi:hypothetical protein